MSKSFQTSTFVLALFFLNASWAQDSTSIDKFNSLALRIQKMTKKKGNSLEHLNVVYSYLSEYANANKSAFKDLTIQKENYCLSERMRYVARHSRGHRLEQALSAVAKLSDENPQDTRVASLDIDTKKRAQKLLEKNITDRNARYTLEPSLGFYTLGKKPNEFAFFRSETVNVIFGLAGYKTLGLKKTNKIASKQKYTYSQIGIKMDYFNGMLIPQLSGFYNRFVGIDLGYAINIDTQQNTSSFYNLNIAAYYPMDFISIGVNARFLSDFIDEHFMHYGLSLKYNLKLGPKVSKSEQNQIKKNIENMNATELK